MMWRRAGIPRGAGDIPEEERPLERDLVRRLPEKWGGCDEEEKNGGAFHCAALVQGSCHLANTSSAGTIRTFSGRIFSL